MRNTSGIERLSERFPPPDVTFSAEYADRHRALVEEAIHANVITAGELPGFYGVGFDERVIELPWALARLRGRTLDAGSALNHAYVLDHLPADVSLHIITAAPEPVAFPERGVSYIFGDFRELPFRDRYYDTVACISSLEHVGMDNARYGGLPRESDPDAAVEAALREFRRVVADNGRLLLSVPFGAAEDHGWFRQYGPTELAALERALDARSVETTVFAYSRDGWQRSTPQAASHAHYRDAHADPRPAVDRAAAARAVACLLARY